MSRKRRSSTDNPRGCKGIANSSNGGAEIVLTTTKTIWFERLLQTPIADYRKNAIALILSRYLVNVRQLSAEDSYAIIKDWLDKCKSVSPLEKGYDYD